LAQAPLAGRRLPVEGRQSRLAVDRDDAVRQVLQIAMPDAERERACLDIEKPPLRAAITYEARDGRRL
jgi:hypothetical protein